MSAFLVSRRHIDHLVAGSRISVARLQHQGIPEARDARGAMLWRENALSVAYRYEEEPFDTSGYSFRWPRPLSAVALLKALHCYVYQSCEHPGWERSAARRYCDLLERHVVRTLPGYQNAAWSIPDDAEGGSTHAAL
jgi:hypothetical protein